MLVLSRRVGERICIGDEVVISLLSIDGNRIRLGFDAPADVAIVREELLLRDRQIEVEYCPVPAAG